MTRKYFKVGDKLKSNAGGALSLWILKIQEKRGRFVYHYRYKYLDSDGYQFSENDIKTLITLCDFNNDP